MNSIRDRSAELKALMAERILILDGAMGTMLANAGLVPSDFGGNTFDGCNEILTETRPEIVREIHEAYLAAGADIIETNTFGASPIVLEDYGLAERAFDLNRHAAELARRAADAASTPDRPRFVAGSIGPTSRPISVTGGVSFDELLDAFTLQARGLLTGGVDIFLVETCQDTRNTKAAIIAVGEVCREAGVHRPVIASCTIETSGTMLAGQSAASFAVSLEHFGLLGIGLNCATGPEAMSDHLRSLDGIVPGALVCYPNAGMPDEDGRYLETPEKLAAALKVFADAGRLNIVGGCCGTTDTHIRAIAAMAEGKKPRPLPTDLPTRVFFTGIDLVESTSETRPLLIGERTNVIGSRKFKKLINGEYWEEATEVARRQVAEGAQIIDVCLQGAERDEARDTESFYPRLIRAVRVPLMIDSISSEIVEIALKYCQGRSIVNSINLENGEKRFEEICPLLRRFGAAVVVGAIDNDPVQPMAVTRERKLEVLEKSREILKEKYGMSDRDLIFDPLVFPVATGDESFIGAAVETIEGLRLLRNRFPGIRTLLGISNVSFGLPPTAREVINSVFLYHCTKAGLDLAIVNTERLRPFAGLDPGEREMAEDLLFNRPPGRGELAAASPNWKSQNPGQRAAINRLHIERVTGAFRKAAPTRTKETVPSLDEKLRRFIVEGTREGLCEALDQKLEQGAEPLEIVNGPLLSGMEEVGRLFKANELIVTEVLRSAESMKAAVAHLENFMDAGAASRRGRILLATVRGDVHDIGKNLVGIILANNGFDVIDLGIRVGPEQLIEAVGKHQPDAVGLSGLLVSSAHQMIATAEDLRAAGISLPLLTGGAALSRKFVRSKIAPRYSGEVMYCADPMAGLDVMNTLMDRARRSEILPGAVSDGRGPSKASSPSARKTTRRKLSVVSKPLLLPFPGRVLSEADLDDAWEFLDRQALASRYLGLRGSFRRLLKQGDPRVLKLEETVREIQADVRSWMRIRTAWAVFGARVEGEEIILSPPGRGADLFRFRFQGPGRRGPAAFFAEPEDSVALFVLTAGGGVREHARQARAEGRYLFSHGIEVLAIETAEAAAEWLCREILSRWQSPDASGNAEKSVARCGCRGHRFSPGYPAWPDLEDQRGIFSLLGAGDIGLRLTEGMMMEPEASVSGIVFRNSIS